MSFVDALIGAQGGIVAIWCTIPLEKLQQKSATERDENGKPKAYLQIASEILSEKGITAFWNGIDVLPSAPPSHRASLILSPFFARAMLMFESSALGALEISLAIRPVFPQLQMDTRPPDRVWSSTEQPRPPRRPSLS